jgi:hypothetical protein
MTSSRAVVVAQSGLTGQDLFARSRTPGHEPDFINSLFIRLYGKINQYGQAEREEAIRKRDDGLSRLIRAREGARFACGRRDIPLDARHFRRRARMAARFDSRYIAGQGTKENRFKGRNLQKFSLAIDKRTLQELVQLSTQP